MSEFLKTATESRSLRWHLMATASMLVLAGSTFAIDAVSAEETSNSPTVWIELGGQLERTDGGQEAFAPTFFDTMAQDGFTSPLKTAHPARYSNGAEGAVRFSPGGTDWSFAASVRYGRSQSHKLVHQQSPALVTSYVVGHQKYKTAAPAYGETKVNSSQTHAIADFQAGKDFGLGLFGTGGSSILNFGVRFAQFSSRSDLTVRARPNVQFVPDAIGGFNIPQSEFHEYFASLNRATSFRGLGPSIAWAASARIAGNPDAAQIGIDWGLNAAVLFGRQKAIAHHLSSGNNRYLQGKYPHTAHTPAQSGNGDRSHSVVSPNLGGFAAISFDYDRAQIKFGYRADAFFGAVDGGLDTRKSYAREFYGPFATISVGFGG